MNAAHEIDPISTHHLLHCLALAVDEAKLVRSLVQAKELADRLKKETPFSERLIYLNREIGYLEKKLAKVRATAARNRETLKLESAKGKIAKKSLSEKKPLDWSPN